ncbi:MAG TPA: galactokinase family protein [Gemmatimonadaceae bacterium]|nr:galactokinase family protein [Gemmatimonadaceae bacterium]
MASRLFDAGMAEDRADRIAERFEMLHTALRALGVSASTATRAYWVPGRIEFLGKHTDYAGGRSLLCTVERGICMLAAPRRHGRVRIHDARSRETASFRLQPDVVPEAGHWSNYPMTVARRISRNFPGALLGADVVFASDLPPAAGMSSSSALVTAVFLALSDINDFSARVEYRRTVRTTEDLAEYLGAVESGRSFRVLAGDTGVGTQGGCEDHTALLCSRPDALIQYAFGPVRHERTIELPAGHHFVIAVSGVHAEKTGAARDAYNRASRAMSEILERWRRTTGRDDATVAAAVASSPDAATQLRASIRDGGDGDMPASALLDRLEHFLTESDELIPAAGDALARSDLEALGTLVDRSQQDAERLLGNQTPETIALARIARELGAVAASAFGAGFGGSVWALVRSDQASELRARWTERYGAEFPAAASHAEFIETRAGPAATRL